MFLVNGISDEENWGDTIITDNNGFIWEYPSNNIDLLPSSFHTGGKNTGYNQGKYILHIGATNITIQKLMKGCCLIKFWSLPTIIDELAYCETSNL